MAYNSTTFTWSLFYSKNLLSNVDTLVECGQNDEILTGKCHNSHNSTDLGHGASADSKKSGISYKKIRYGRGKRNRKQTNSDTIKYELITPSHNHNLLQDIRQVVSNLWSPFLESLYSAVVPGINNNLKKTAHKKSPTVSPTSAPIVRKIHRGGRKSEPSQDNADSESKSSGLSVVWRRRSSSPTPAPTKSFFSVHYPMIVWVPS